MAAKQKATRDAAESSRLDPQAWVDAALEMLANGGVDAVRIDPLAKSLGITRGSFYWHFKDRDALLEAMLTYWRRHATLDIIARLEGRGASPRDRLAQLLRIPFRGARADRTAEVELAVRLWGRRDPRARAALEEVDQLRLRYIEGLLEGVGFEPGDAAVRAVFSYAFMRVAGTLIEHGDDELIGRCIALVVDGPGVPAGAGEGG